MGWTYEDFLNKDELFTLDNEELIDYELDRATLIMNMKDSSATKINYILEMIGHGVSMQSLIERYPDESSLFKIVYHTHSK